MCRARNKLGERVPVLCKAPCSAVPCLTCGCTSPGMWDSNRQQVFKHEPRVLSNRNPEMWSSGGLPVDQKKDGDISPLARVKLLCLGSLPQVPLPSSSDTSGKYYRVGFNHRIWAILKKKIYI